MASFTGVGDNVELSIPAKGETIDIDISGTYDMTILFQREQGSPGSDAWATLLTFNTANATVAEAYTSISDNEVVRLIVTVDTSGTATATLTDNDDRITQVFRDQAGTPVLTLNQGGVTVEGTLTVDGASTQTGNVTHSGTLAVTGATTLTGNATVTAGLLRTASSVVDETTATLTLTQALHAGRVVTLNRAAGVTVTMPAATGLGDVYTIFTGTTVTSNNNIIQAASASDVFNGGVAISTDVAGITMLAAATTDTITMNGSTTGGLAGSWVRLTDVASGVFQLEGFLVSTGVEADPFSAAV